MVSHQPLLGSQLVYSILLHNLLTSPSNSSNFQNFVNIEFLGLIKLGKLTITYSLAFENLFKDKNIDFVLVFLSSNFERD